MDNISTALRLVSSMPWAITSDYMRIIEDIASGNSDPVALSTQLGRPLQNARSVEVRGGVAVIPVHSVIFRRASLLNEISGNAASVDVIAKDFVTALNDPAIKAILFDFDTPGGQAAGITELADTIFAARGTKRIVGYVEDLCASAGYWTACACSELVLGRAAKVGSIGVIVSQMVGGEKGRKSVTSKNAVNKNVPVDTRRGEDLLQQDADKMEEMFISDVARLRNVSVEKVLSDFGQGGILYADEAVAVGMADRIGSFEEVLASLQQSDNAIGTAVSPQIMSAFAGTVHAALNDQITIGKVNLND